jgi:nucleotide-binding universal stress UspA family protein
MQVLVLIDGQHSRELLDALSRLLLLEDAELLLAYVTGPGPRAGLEMVRDRPGARPLPPDREQELRDSEMAATAETVAQAEQAARVHSSAVETVQLTGRPGHEICDLAERRGVDLVVVRVGGRDRPPIGPGSLGPAAKFIADHSRRPVLLIRTP